MVRKDPVFSIQCDWDTVLRSSGSQVWVSYRIKGNPGVHGKIKCTQGDMGKLQYESSEELIVKRVSSNFIELYYPIIDRSAIFLAPLKTESQFHTRSILTFDVNSSGLVVSSDLGGRVVVWDSLQNEEKLILKGHAGEAYKCRFFPSGKVILTGGSDMQLKIWCAVSGRCPVTLIGHTGSITDFCIIDRGKNILSVSKDGYAKLWNCAQGRCLDNVTILSSAINCCAISEAPDGLELGEPSRSPSDLEVGTEGKLVLFGCEDGSLHCISLYSRKPVFNVTCGSAINAVTFISRTKFSIGCQNGMVLVYEVSVPEGEALLLDKVDYSSSPVLAMLSVCSFSGDRCVFVSRSDGAVTLLSKNLPHELILTGSDCDPVYDMSFNGSYLFTCCRDSSIRRYSIKVAMNKVSASS